MSLGTDKSFFLKKETWSWALALTYVLIVFLAMWPYFVDDAYIGFHYIDNAIHGKGFVFNPPDRVEGVTNSGWLLILLPFALVWPVAVVAKILSLGFVLGTLVLTVKMAARVPPEREMPVLFFIPLLTITNLDFIVFSFTGMETAVMACGLCLMIFMADRYRFSSTLAFFGATLFLIRPESVLIYPLAMAFLNGRNRSHWKKHAWAILGFFGMIVLMTIGRKIYFGDFVPNTFFAKTSSLRAILENVLYFLKGTHPNVSLPFIGGLALPVWAIGFLRIRRRNPILASFSAAALLTGLIFANYAKADWTHMGRYFAPYVPIAVWLFLTGGAELFQRIAAFSRKTEITRFIFASLCLVLAATGMARMWFFFREVQIGEYPGYVLTSVSLVGPSLWMRDHLPERAVIAAGRIGAVSYFSHKKVFDYKFGLTDRRVARLKRKLHREFDDPRDLALRTIWQDVKPDYFLEDLDRIREIFHFRPGPIPAFDIHGLTYRLIKRFKIGIKEDWALCARVD